MDILMELEIEVFNNRVLDIPLNYKEASELYPDADTDI